MNFIRTFTAITFCSLLLQGLIVNVAKSCPFCEPESSTLSEEIGNSQTVVLARLIEPGLEPDRKPDGGGGFGNIDPDTGTAKFEIIEVLRGEDRLDGQTEIEVVFFGMEEKDQVFMISDLGEKKEDSIDWGTPMPLSKVAVPYVRKLLALSESGAERLVFFQDYLQHEDPLLSQDAYDEFARAPYDDLKAIGSEMNRDQLVEFILDAGISPSRRRLYLTMLGICGTTDDLPLLEDLILSNYSKKKPLVEAMIQATTATVGPSAMPIYLELVKQDERRKKLGLDAQIACYLKLRGPSGLDVIEERFLMDPKTDYSHIYSTIMALRFHGEETEDIPRERLLQSVRMLLNNPLFADQVVPDLSRWEDWSVLDRLVTMFKESEKRSFLRQPVIVYLTVAAEVEGDVGKRAAAAIAELEALDPGAVESAQRLMAFGALARSRPESPTLTDDASATEEGEEADLEKKEDQAIETESLDAKTSKLDNVIEDPTNSRYRDLPLTGDPVQKALVGAANLTPEENSEEIASVPEQTIQTLSASSDRQPLPSRVIIIAVPAVLGISLMGVYWLVLRSGIA